MEAEPSRELGGEVERMAPEEDDQAGRVQRRSHGSSSK